jgi:hypothetical protein
MQQKETHLAESLNILSRPGYNYGPIINQKKQTGLTSSMSQFTQAMMLTSETLKLSAVILS